MPPSIIIKSGQSQSPSVFRVEEALSKAGHKGQVKELNLPARSAKDAAASLKVELGAIVKTLVFSFEYNGLRKPVLALIDGDKTCDVEELKNELKITGKYSRLGANEVKQITGYTIGGVSPVGLSVEIPKVIDISIFRPGGKGRNKNFVVFEVSGGIENFLDEKFK